MIQKIIRCLTTILFLSIFLLKPLPVGAESAEKSEAASSAKSLWNHFSLFSVVKALAVEGDTLWVGTSNGLLKYNLASEDQQVYTTKNGLLSNMIHTITIGPNGDKWIGTYGGGLNRLRGEEWQSYTPYGFGSHASYGKAWKLYPAGKGVGDLWVYGIHFDPEGVMWVATWKGVSRFDGTAFKTYTTDDGLIDKWVYTLTQDQKGDLWFGTEGGVTRFSAGKWKSWTNEDGVGINVDDKKPPEAQGLPSIPRHHAEGGHKPLSYNPNYVVSSVVDQKNHLWIGTLGGGLSRFDGKSWKTYSTKDGLSGNMIHALTIDSKGIMWIGTDGGVSRFDGKGFSNLTEKDGIGAVFAIAIDRQGHKWFGTFGGVSQYRGD